MALIEVYHVVASQLPIDADAATDIPQGSIVSLNNNGQVVLCNGDDTEQWPIGIAGDTRSTGITSFTPESGSSLSRNPKTSLTGALVIGSQGAQQRYPQNRVADNYNEVLASGKMTVYHSGGEFWTDQYEIIGSGGTSVLAYHPAMPLYSSGVETAGGTARGEPETASVGRFTTEPAANIEGVSPIVGFVLTSPTAYPSGVPGTETGFNSLPEGGNSLSWGTFLHVKLAI